MTISNPPSHPESQLESESMEILRKIRNHLEQMMDHRPKIPLPKAPVVATSPTECVCCLLPIESGHFFLSMPCCGAMCHIVCMARIANGHTFSVAHACQHCQSDLTHEFTTSIIRMWRVIESFSRLTDD
jgi:hypothetical protein